MGEAGMPCQRSLISLVVTIISANVITGLGIQPPAFCQNASPILAGAIDASSERIAIYRSDRGIGFFSAASAQLIRSVNTDDVVEQMAFSPDGHNLAAAGMLHIRIYDADRGVQTGEVNAGPRVITSLAFTPDRKELVVGDASGFITEVDLNAGKTVRSWEAHDQSIASIAVSPDGRYIAAGSWDTTISLWDTATGLRKGLLKGHTKWVTTLAFDHRSKKLISGGFDSLVNVWDLATGKCLASGGLTLMGIPMMVNAVLFSTDDKYIFGTSVGMIGMFDAASGATIRTFDHQSAQAWLIANRVDNRHIEVFGKDGSLALLDITGAEPEQHMMLQ